MIEQFKDSDLLNSSGEVLLVSSPDLLAEDYSKIDIPLKISNAVASRKIEFQKGRYLAKKILLKFNCNEAVGIGEGREPVWPDGFIGSISHCKDYYVTAISRSIDVNGIGVDIEKVGRIKPELCRMIHTEWDISNSHLSNDELNTLIFSAKESLYKMLYPKVLKFFGFKEAAIVSVEENSFTIQLKSTLSNEHKAGDTYEGRFILVNDHLLSYIEY